MIMLSRVAERVYWLGRYLERTENLARTILVYNGLMLDLPSGNSVTWYNLVELNDAEAMFHDHYDQPTEKNVLHFLLDDARNPASLINGLKMLRENVRTTRDAVQYETWEHVNELYLFAMDNVAQGIMRKGRYEFLSELIARCQQIQGLLSGTMLHGKAWTLYKLGVHLERGDQTSRILDAGISILVRSPEDAYSHMESLIWVNVLRSVSGELPYRVGTGRPVEEKATIAFMVRGELFPRSAKYSIHAIWVQLKKMPNGKALKPQVKQVKSTLKALKGAGANNETRALLNQMQLDLAALHQAIADQWFALNE